MIGFERRSRVADILQTEAAECGLACISAIAGFHGNHVDLRALRAAFPVSLRGTTLKRLIEIARSIGFTCRPVRLEPEHLSDLVAPAVLHWNMNHYVVLERAERHHLVIHDPAIGRRRVSREEASRCFTGVALEMTPGESFRKRGGDPAIRLRDLLDNMPQLWKAGGLLLACSIAIQLFVLAGPYLLQSVLDDVLVSGDRRFLLTLVAAFLVILGLQVATSATRAWTVAHVSARLSEHWTALIAQHMFRLPLDFFEKRQLSDLVSRLGGIASIQRTLSANSVEAIIDGVMAILVLSMLAAYSVPLAALSIAAIMLYAGLRLVRFRKLREDTHLHLVAAARQQGHLLESLRAILTIKSCGMESIRLVQWGALQTDTLMRDNRLAWHRNLFTSANQLIFGTERIAVITVAGFMALDGAFTAGMLVAYLGYRELFAQRVSTLIDRIFDFGMLRLHLDRVGEIVLSVPERTVAIPKVQSEHVDTAPMIEVRGLVFRYAAGEPAVLDDCSFAIWPGESVAIVGPSGCGKTTLLKLVSGLLEPSEGEIRIGGLPFRELDPARIRSSFGIVMQDDQLFSGTIAQNIAMFDDDPDPADVMDAARAAGLCDMLELLPMGVHTLVGDSGRNFSGGQKQRIVLARALYRRPQVLLLDEATSHLDAGNEARVNAAIRKLSITRIIVAHRPDTIRSADRVLELRHGRIPANASSVPSPSAVAGRVEVGT